MEENSHVRINFKWSEGGVGRSHRKFKHKRAKVNIFKIIYVSFKYYKIRKKKKMHVPTFLSYIYLSLKYNIRLTSLCGMVVLLLQTL